MRTTTPILALALLGGCATTPQLRSDVSTFSEWAAARSPATYAFERLPSQQRWSERQQRLEDAARGALQAAGFTQAADGNGADVIVQVGARARTERTLQSSAATRHKPRMPAHDFSSDPAYVTIDRREAALLIRDRETGHPLYGASASNRGRSISDPAILTAMFVAAMKDFPNASANPRQTTVELGR